MQKAYWLAIVMRRSLNRPCRYQDVFSNEAAFKVTSRPEGVGLGLPIQGFTRRNALEIVLGIGALTLSTLANRLTGAPVDEQLRAFA